MVVNEKDMIAIDRPTIQVFQGTEGETPSSVAYDTPSPKLLAFLKKHYGELPSNSPQHGAD